jgi:hypothetical protein
LPDHSLAGDLCVVKGLNNYTGNGMLRDVGNAQRSEDRIELAQAKNLCIRHMRGIFGLPGLAKPTNPVGLICLNANGLSDQVDKRSVNRFEGKDGFRIESGRDNYARDE